MKKFLALLMTVALGAILCFSGCGLFSSNGVNGRDGVDGSDVSIYEIWEATNRAREEEGLSTLTFLEFVEEYLSYNNSELNDVTSMQGAINNSLRSAVGIYSRFVSNRGIASGGFGSGVIWKMDNAKRVAYIVTNCHVIYDGTVADKVSIFTYGQDAYSEDYRLDTSYELIDTNHYAISAEIIGAAVSYDIAVLRITDSGYDKLKNAGAQAVSMVSEASEFYLGEQVYTIGNQQGYGTVTTTGIISGDSEYISVSMTGDDEDAKSYHVVRTDAAVNGGGSGGGIYNRAGELIGIVNAKDDNIGYALPIYDVKGVVENLIDRYNTKNRFELGINVGKIGASYTYKTSYHYDTTINRTKLTDMVSINDVDSSSPFKNGLRINDTLLYAQVVDENDEIIVEGDINREYTIKSLCLYVRPGYTLKIQVRHLDNTVNVLSHTYSSSDFTVMD